VTGRSQTKCYHRYIHLTRKQIKIEFEPKDDQLLIEQHQVKKARWSQIQPLFPGRSCHTLQNRWRKLVQYRQTNELFDAQQVLRFLYS
jgi:Myb-like DNA-binding domain